MSKILTLARRELAGYFFSPMAYIVGGLFLCVCGLKFIPLPNTNSSWAILQSGQEASLRPLFDMMAMAMIVAGPLLTMRLMSDEYHSGTVATLLTAPVTDAQVILGKFVGVLAFYVVLLATTLVYLLLMVLFGQPDPGVAAMGYLGMLLLGSAYLAVGVFASTTTQYQLVAAIVGVVILSALVPAMQFLVAQNPGTVGQLAGRLNAMSYFRDFSRGVFDTRGVVYFLSVTGLFLFLSVKTLESKRWR